MSTVLPLRGMGRTGLVLTAGGARGAYQAGVLKRIGEIPAFGHATSPFPIISGASAGAINGAVIAAHSSAFLEGTVKLAELWAGIRPRDVFRTDPLALAGNAARMALDFALGSVLGAGRVRGLLDTSPLRRFLGAHLPVWQIGEAIARRDLYAIAVTATSYHSGKSYIFIQGAPGHPVWHKRRRVTLRVALTLDHILASSAIPVVFPPVPVTITGATAYFGDGALRLATPLSPAIRLGADRLLAIGVRCTESADELLRAEMAPGDEEEGAHSLSRPPLSQIAGVFMNAIFLDHLDADVDHLERMNELVAAYGRAQAPAPGANGAQVSEPMRIVTPLVINPSEDPAILARSLAHRMPRAIRAVLDGLGAPDAKSADLMSYLLFDSAYTRQLIEVGYRDADKQLDRILELLEPEIRASVDGAARSAL